MANQNVVSINQNKPRESKLGIVVFLCILVYILICVFGYMTQKHIVPYQVKEGALSVNNTYRAIALRDEMVVQATGAGYINYYAREGSRVAFNDLVYTLDETGHLSEYIKGRETGESSLTASDLSELRADLISFGNSFDERNFQTVYDFKYTLEGDVVKLGSYNLLENMNNFSDANAGMIQYCAAPKTGIIVYNYDGFEDLTIESITKDTFNEEEYEKVNLLNNELIGSGDRVYKLCTNEDWSIVIQVDEEKAKELAEEGYVLVRFLKNQYESWGKVEAYAGPMGDNFVKLTFTNSMISFCTDRFLDVELLLDTQKGLKIPLSSIAEKTFYIVPRNYITKSGSNEEEGVLLESFAEDGTMSTKFVATTIYNETDTDYYIDGTNLKIGEYIVEPSTDEKYAISKQGSLIGVYCVNKGYADFRQINVLLQNDEYAIVEPNTMYGLNVYDYIALDAKSVGDDELLYK